MTDSGFQRSLMISLSGHFAVAAFLFLRAVFVPDEPIDIRSAIRVDVVSLPQKISTPEASLPPASSEPAPAPVEKAKETPQPKAETKPEASKIPDPKAKKTDIAKTQKKALEELKRREALDKIKEQLSSTKGKDPQPGKQIAGNKLSAGNSLTGLDKLEYDRYFDEIRDKMRANFSLPQWLADSGYKAQVQVLVDERGLILKKIIVRSSGNEVFDAKAIEAVEASAPLPAPPQRLQGLLSTSGIIFGFPE